MKIPISSTDKIPWSVIQTVEQQEIFYMKIPISSTDKIPWSVIQTVEQSL